MEARGDTDGSTASGGEGAQGGGGASSYSDDPETELRQIMRSSDFQKFCSLCQMQGQGDVFAICRQHVVQTFMDHRGQKRLNELDEERQKLLEAQRLQLVALLSAEEVCNHMHESLSPCV
eukprot:scaffold78003_cov27-Phaeocystis_antarctica.AAC.1